MDLNEQSLNSEELKEVRRAILVRDVKEELIFWAKRWTTVLTIVIGIVGLVGLNVIVATTVRGFLSQEIRDAQKASVVATESSERAKKAMDAAVDTAEKYTATIAKLQTEAETLQDDLKRVRADIDGLRRSGNQELELVISSLNEQVNELAKKFDQLSASTKRAGSQSASNSIEKLTNQARQTRKEFLENNSVLAQIAYQGQTNQIADSIRLALERAGYRTALYPNENAKKNEQIFDLMPGTLQDGNVVYIIHDPNETSIAEAILAILRPIVGKRSVQLINDKIDETQKEIGIFISDPV